MLTDNEAVVEAILFASGEPVKFDKIAQVLEKEEKEIKDIVSSLSEKYEGRGIQLLTFEDSCQLCSREEYEVYVKRAMGIRAGTLSNSTMEALAIVAYNQPVTRAFIEQVRGVDSSYVISTLCEKKLIDICGKLDVPGKPNLYATTDTFLRVFGLSSLSELPKKEFIESNLQNEELSGEERSNEELSGEEKTKEEQTNREMQGDLSSYVDASDAIPDIDKDQISFDMSLFEESKKNDSNSGFDESSKQDAAGADDRVESSYDTGASK